MDGRSAWNGLFAGEVAGRDATDGGHAADLVFRRRLRARMSRAWAARLLGVTAVLIGLLAVAVPLMWRAEEDARLQSVAQTTDADIDMRGDALVREQIILAQAYNRSVETFGTVMRAEAVDPMGGDDSARSVSDRTYRNALDMDGTGYIGSIAIEAIGVRLPIYHGTGAATLLRGAGHLYGSSLPVESACVADGMEGVDGAENAAGVDGAMGVGGAADAEGMAGANDVGGVGDVDVVTDADGACVGSHVVLSAHTGLADATMFSRLDTLTFGQEFSLHVAGTTMRYRIDGIAVVEPNRTDLFGLESGEDRVSLLTCVGLGNTKRLVVSGVRAPPSDADETSSGESVSASGEVPRLGGIVFMALGGVSWLALCGAMVAVSLEEHRLLRALSARHTRIRPPCPERA
ncbi:sortase [Bifidobacterium eulemuris]|nr:sortase [Bifidobacterium eulemuris]QOL32058.1 class C sortase [Bifidobacterium eulemuris]